MTLKEYRQLHNITQGYLAGAAHVGPTAISYAEAGRYVMTREQARRIADFLGVDAMEIDELRAAMLETKLPEGRE